ncbi:MAG: 50S ribosomal protein L13 [Chitinispirillaceae bacterium]|nr:50S ribosomal protein L13 [Chitinispirillaceae bacterium]
MKTVVVDLKSIKHNWVIVDATGQMVGRVASKVANILIGKNKVAYSPNQDHGDYVIVINAGKVQLSGKKPHTKRYFRHSGHPGGEKFRSFKEQMALDPTQVIRHAVHGMVSKNALGRSIMKKLHVYRNAEHPHAAQRPAPVSLS